MTIVFSVGGSVVAPDKIDSAFVKEFAVFLRALSKKQKIAVVVGGGRPARRSIERARARGVNEAACDLLGIAASRVNARAVAKAFGVKATQKPPESIAEAARAFKAGKVVVMGGTEPGHSTDAVAAILAELVGASLLVNASNVDFVYDSDPKKNPGAKPFKSLPASELVRLVSAGSIRAGGYALMDLTAAKIIERGGIKTFFVDGRDLSNLRAAVEGKRFRGTTVN